MSFNNLQNYQVFNINFTIATDKLDKFVDIDILEFTPDEIVLKYMCVVDSKVSDPAGIVKIRSELVNNNVLVSYPANTDPDGSCKVFERMDIPFKVNSAIRGRYRFYLEPTDYDNYDLSQGDTHINLQFLALQYKK